MATLAQLLGAEQAKQRERMGRAEAMGLIPRNRHQGGYLSTPRSTGRGYSLANSLASGATSPYEVDLGGGNVRRHPMLPNIGLPTQMTGTSDDGVRQVDGNLRDKLIASYALPGPSTLTAGSAGMGIDASMERLPYGGLMGVGNSQTRAAALERSRSRRGALATPDERRAAVTERAKAKGDARLQRMEMRKLQKEGLNPVQSLAATSGGNMMDLLMGGPRYASSMAELGAGQGLIDARTEKERALGDLYKSQIDSDPADLVDYVEGLSAEQFAMLPDEVKQAWTQQIMSRFFPETEQVPIGKPRGPIRGPTHGSLPKDDPYSGLGGTTVGGSLSGVQ